MSLLFTSSHRWGMVVDFFLISTSQRPFVDSVYLKQRQEFDIDREKDPLVAHINRLI
jgi:hypothetical protein